eukprot:TRINITY_DN14974_c0_g2_i2.p1 TRINITY_DN14974_c0_g2~~TRINITY_DN14974_c0_g2_i2.p1  ORF type:complete len:129 (+),score=13.04 TRINITY_DN14974_c0_g2_i2:169-555(+)
MLRSPPGPISYDTRPLYLPPPGCPPLHFMDHERHRIFLAEQAMISGGAASTAGGCEDSHSKKKKWNVSTAENVRRLSPGAKQRKSARGGRAQCHSSALSPPPRPRPPGYAGNFGIWEKGPDGLVSRVY